MQQPFLPLSAPVVREEDISAVADVLRSGWLTTGPKGEEFERRFAGQVGCEQAVAVSSATAGMHLALAALGIGPGDEVVTPSLTWVSTVNLIVLQGATPVFVDVDRDTLMAPPEAFASAISPRTRLIVPVHFAGAAADLAPIREIAAARGVAVVEDAAHAIGTQYRGEPIGRRGTAVFSFHPIKNMTTAEGGMVCSDDAELMARVRRLRFHGLEADAHDRRQQGRSASAEVVEPGYKYNLPDVLAALGVQQLAHVAEFNERRTSLAMRYRERLAGVEPIRPLADPDYPFVHAWHLFVVRVDPELAGMDRAAFMEGLRKHDIGSGIHFLPVHQQAYYRTVLGAERPHLPNTEWNGERIVSLPLHPGMRDKDVDRVVHAIEQILAA